MDGPLATRKPLPALLLVVLPLIIALLGGCKSKPETVERHPDAPIFIQNYPPPNQPGPPTEQPVVFFHGMFSKPWIPWSENLSLAEGLVESEYLGRREPVEIVIIRQSRVYRVNANRLLRRLENPLLLPNDIIEIRR